MVQSGPFMLHLSGLPLLRFVFLVVFGLHGVVSAQPDSLFAGHRVLSSLSPRTDTKPNHLYKAPNVNISGSVACKRYVMHTCMDTACSR
ncbi:hypothetical protein P691DRAFT_801812 [Macrolepiota fuliginosa MF-IS2]|uniref:Liver-expressed antimicrobial peptide 2 n=1 Tax=Macrolepiota fuliginosa MF-IS2 TaxID=1400762 RepID=A0A9P5X0B8_9AGAR|nr:hypothetical protein P691DRAFT_801812 [Macrolepiota fuliginosa MF-IS2]